MWYVITFGIIIYIVYIFIIQYNFSFATYHIYYVGLVSGKGNLQIYHRKESNERPLGLEKTTIDRDINSRSNPGTETEDYGED